MAKLVSKVYSDALFEVAREKDLMDTLFEEAKGLYEVFDSNGELLELLNHPKLVRDAGAGHLGAENSVAVFRGVFHGIEGFVRPVHGALQGFTWEDGSSA